MNSQGNYPSTSKLNDDSMDEDRLAMQLIERQEKNHQQNQAVADLVMQDNFFSKAFDDQQPDDLMGSLQKSLEKGGQIDSSPPPSVYPEAKHSTSSKILFSDEAEEEEKKAQQQEEWKI